MIFSSEIGDALLITGLMKVTAFDISHRKVRVEIKKLTENMKINKAGEKAHKIHTLC